MDGVEVIELAAAAGCKREVLTHRQLLQRIWDSADLEQPRILRVNISNLRHNLETDGTRPRNILTETGVVSRFLCGDYCPLQRLRW